MNKKLPLICPSCDGQLSVKQMTCEVCDTDVSGLFQLPALSRLSVTQQTFILDFVITSGSLKLMAQQMKLSYPTVRNKLDDIIAALEQL